MDSFFYPLWGIYKVVVANGKTSIWRGDESAAVSGMPRTRAVQQQGQGGVGLLWRTSRSARRLLKISRRGKRTPSPNLVLDMARVYQTPELKWLHCSTVCPIGLEIYKKGAGLGTEDIYRTYFELAGAFDRINDVETSLHEIIADDAFTPDEEEQMDEILGVLDKITESTARLPRVD